MISSFNALRDSYKIIRHPNLDRKTVLEFQNRKLKHLIHHTFKNILYYQEAFAKAGVSPKDIQTSTDLALLPFTTRSDIKQVPQEEILTRGINAAGLKTFRTSGSTGVPLIVRRTSREDILFHVFRMRVMKYYGLKSSQRVLRFRTSGLGDFPLLWRILQKLKLYRQVRVDPGISSAGLADLLLQENPDAVTGYPDVLARTALALADRADRIKMKQPLFLISGSNMLTPFIRSQISKAFRGPVYDNYECHEAGLLAWQCKNSGYYHVCDDSVILEVLKDGAPVKEEEKGEVVVTSLHSLSMPFIRYKLGDIVTKGPEICPCGQPFSSIQAIEGRTIDYFILPGKRELYPLPITLLFFQQAPWMMQYELIQERENRVVLRAVAACPPSPEKLQLFVDEIKKLLGLDVEFRLEFVPEIAQGPSGKYRFIRSEVHTHE